jgi:hypothetical protein
VLPSTTRLPTTGRSGRCSRPSAGIPGGPPTCTSRSRRPATSA